MRDDRFNVSTTTDRLHISDLEAAINHWRARRPAAAGAALAPEVAALAEVYAQMVFARQDDIDVRPWPAAAHAAWLAWYATTPDTPCIAICSTSQGDAVCKGCGRTEGEVQHWPALSLWAKRAVWRRITQQGTAWRFNRYAERAPDVVDIADARPPGKTRIDMVCAGALVHCFIEMAPVECGATGRCTST